ncbi:MAG: adenine-specific methyltransferase EcoRI family protein [Firmicutes bacterium]|nr:adenine-specific methyltransferase EcoRI family protein [Bacillota bacterium]
MGVPITFLDKYNPDQFEIIGLGIANLGLSIGVRPYKEEHRVYRKNVQHRGTVDGDLYMVDEEGHPLVPYARILIKRRKQE